MTPSSCVGRVGGLALALGAGALVAVGGAGPVRAEPGDAPDQRGAAAAASTARPAQRAAGPAGHRSEPGPVRRSPGPAPNTARREPARRQSQKPAAATPKAAVTAHAEPAAPSFGEIVQYTLFHRSATANPTQTPGQSPGGVVTGNLNAGNPNGAALTFTLSQAPARGSVVLDEKGLYTYTPDDSLASTGGSDTFGVTIDNGAPFRLTGIGGTIQAILSVLAQLVGLRQPDTVTTAVTVTIAGPAPPTDPTNSAPVALGTTVGAPDPVTGTVAGRIDATDPDGDALTYGSPITAGKGTADVNGSGEFTYTPTQSARHTAARIGAPAADHADVFTVTISDGRGGTVATTVTVAVAPSNTAPVARAATMNANPTTGVVVGTVNAVDADDDALTYTAVTGATAKGAVLVTNTGSFTYTPTDAARQQATGATATSADKSDAFSVSVADGYGGIITVSVNVPVSPVSPPPPPVPATGRMAVGMNLENVVDWSPAWTFTDAFKASRPWISHSFNPQTWQTTWDPADAPTLNLDADGNVRSLKTWTENGVQMQQHAGTLMFDGLGGAYAGGTYHAQWDGTGTVTFGMDAVVASAGRTAEGRNFAELTVSPTDSGIYLRIEQTDPADPVRNINVWMPDFNGQSFVGQRWQPGAAFSPFHPLFLARLSPFGTLRFMGMQETNTTDIVTWSQRRDASDIRQGSGSGGTPSEPVVNGISVEYMVELANELDADPWFNMPYAADDTFVRNFAGYVSAHLEPGRKVYVEWANEVWNFGWGFEASQWVADQARTAGLDPDFGQWIVAGREAKRDMAIWSEVLAGRSDLDLVRVAAGWAAVDWVTNQIAENMDGAFDAIAIAPYITPTDEQRAAYTAGTSVEQVLADTRSNMTTALQWVANHEELAQSWSDRLGRPIELIAYEGGAHLDGRGGAYQGAFYAAGLDPRMGLIYRDYLRALDAAGMDLYVDFQFTGQAGAAPWGDFAKLHRMNEPLSGAHRYNAVVAAADGSLWTTTV